MSSRTSLVARASDREENMTQERKTAHNDDSETIDAPVMDGADEVFDGDEDPRKGEADPALVRHPVEDDKTIAPYNL